MTSRHGDHTAAYLKELSLTFELLVIEKNPWVLWLKYKLNINKTGIFEIHFYFLYFFNVNDNHGTFFKGRIRFLVRSNRLRIQAIGGCTNATVFSSKKWRTLEDEPHQWEKFAR